MTELLEHPRTDTEKPETIEKVAIVISKGSLEHEWPAELVEPAPAVR